MKQPHCVALVMAGFVVGVMSNYTQPNVTPLLSAIGFVQVITGFCLLIACRYESR